MKKTNATVRNRLIVTSLCLTTFFTPAGAQQWSGSTTTANGIFRSGNVGIGLASAPSFPLHIFTNTSPSGNYGLIHTDGTVQVGTWVGTANGVDAGWFGTRTNHALHFFTNDGGPQMTIQNGSGHVGINSGNSFPGRLTVKDSFVSILTTADGGNANTSSCMGILATGQNNGGGTVYGVYGTGQNSQITYGIFGRGWAAAAAQTSYGTHGEAVGNAASQTLYGTHGIASGAGGSAYGTYGHAMMDNGTGYGVYGQTWLETAGTAYGVYGYALNKKSGNAYGVYGSAAAPGGSAYAGYFAGNTMCGATYFPSDEKLKTNIQPLGHAMELIQRLHPKTYEFRQSDEFSGLKLGKGKKYGLISQELEQVVPEIVQLTHNPEIMDQDGKVVSRAFEFKAVDYVSLIPILIAGIKEQQEEIAVKDARLQLMEQQLNELRNAVNELKTFLKEHNGQPLGNNTPATDKISLGQNIPNPLSNTTVIPYYLPQTVNGAQIQIINLEGKVMLSQKLTQTGSGQIEVNTTAWTSGIYTYYLYINGSAADTKKMVIEK